MEYHRLRRPLPLILIFLFVAVAVVDLFQKLNEEPLPPPEIAGAAIPRFEVLEPVIDFRTNGGDADIEILPVPEVENGQWSAPEIRGIWAKGANAEFQLELAAGGHRTLIFECLPASGKRPVSIFHLTINGIDCGSTELAAEWKRYRVVLPEGVVRPGSNNFALRFPDRDPAARVRRALLIRKLGWFFDESVGVEALDRPPPISIDLEADRIKIRRSGILELPIVLDDRTDALQMRYRFSAGAGRADLVVEQDGNGGYNDAMGASMRSDDGISGRVRIPLHGRRGAFVIRIRTELERSGAQLLLSSLRLVEEGDPTLRPGARDSPPD
jgi:hypothetical protein